MVVAEPKSDILRENLWRFSKDQYYRLSEMGWFMDTRVELIEGVIVEKYPDTPLPRTAFVAYDGRSIPPVGSDGLVWRTAIGIDRGRYSRHAAYWVEAYDLRHACHARSRRGFPQQCSDQRSKLVSGWDSVRASARCRRSSRQSTRLCRSSTD